MARSTRNPIDRRDPVVRGHPLNKGRLAWWLALPHRAGGSNLYDLMGRYHAQAVGTSKWTRRDQFAELAMDGTFDFRADASALGQVLPITYGVRFTPDAAFIAGSGQVLFGRWADDASFYWLHTMVYSANRLSTDCAGQFAYSGAWTPVEGQESTLIYTATGARNQFLLYVDGVVQSMTEHVWNGSIVDCSAVPWYIGGHNAERRATGRMAEAFVYNRVLTPTEIAELHLEMKSGHTGLIRRRRGTSAALLSPFASPSLIAGSASFVGSGPGGDTAYISAIATAPTGGSGAGPTYQWERSDDGGAYADVTGQTSLTLDDTTVATGHIYSYRCKQTRGTDTVTTNAVTARVYLGGPLSGGSRNTLMLRRSR